LRKTNGLLRHPSPCTICIQSQVPELAVLSQLLLNYVTVSRLERNPTVREEMRQRGFERADGENGAPALGHGDLVTHALPDLHERRCMAQELLAGRIERSAGLVAHEEHLRPSSSSRALTRALIAVCVTCRRSAVRRKLPAARPRGRSVPA